MKIRRLILGVVLALVLTLMLNTSALAETSQDVTVTAIPEYIAIANAPDTWTINGITGSGIIKISTTYYSNPLGDTVSPGSTVVDNECRFTITNTSGVAIDLTINFPNHTGGDASTNSNTGSPGTNSFGACGYYSGMLYTNKVVTQSSGSDPLKDALPASTNIKWGIEYTSQTGN